MLHALTWEPRWAAGKKIHISFECLKRLCGQQAGGSHYAEPLRRKRWQEWREKGAKESCEHTPRAELGISIRIQGSTVLGASVAVICWVCVCVCECECGKGWWWFLIQIKPLQSLNPSWRVTITCRGCLRCHLKHPHLVVIDEGGFLEKCQSMVIWFFFFFLGRFAKPMHYRHAVLDCN